MINHASGVPVYIPALFSLDRTEDPMTESKELTTAAPDEKKVAEFKPNPAFQTALVPKNVADAMHFATILSKSNVVPKDMIGKPEACFVAIGFGMELGLPPLQAVQNIMVVNGRPTLWGDAAIALVMGSRLCEMFDEDPAHVAIKQGFGRCRLKRVGGRELEVRFSMEDAKRAGLTSKPGPWQQYTGRMLVMRARSWAMRDVFPDVLKGMQIREEVDDYEIVPERAAPAMPVRESEYHTAKVVDAVADAHNVEEANAAHTAAEAGDAQEPVAPEDMPISEAERQELFKMRSEAKISVADTQKFLADSYGITSTAALPKSKLEEFKSWIVKNAKA